MGYGGVEAGTKPGREIRVDRPRVQIPVVVAAKSGENPLRRKSKGSWPMFVRPGEVDPKW